MGFYLRPTAVEEAVRALGERPLAIVAGGTDFYPARVGRVVDEDVLDLSALAELRRIEDAGDHIRIGALVTWSGLIAADLPAWFRTLKLAAREVGGIQVQNAGTIAGNICNASPAADGVPALIALDAAVELASARGTRRVPLTEFIIGNRRTVRMPGELVTAIRIPKPSGVATSTFLKLGARRYLVISIVMVAAVIERAADGTVGAARIAVGSCAPVARRLPLLEAALAGRPIGRALADVATARHLEPLAPIDDVRGTRDYRLDAALTLVRRALAELGTAT
ncbi:MAG: xanthine dehydrogenase family protein subunit M [Alphaproteobacteria bacterium]|nr:xanthine dehydrogenase family protein subunit M [Alphaproteobacteria bacterium]